MASTTGGKRPGPKKGKRSEGWNGKIRPYQRRETFSDVHLERHYRKPAHFAAKRTRFGRPSPLGSSHQTQLR